MEYVENIGYDWKRINDEMKRQGRGRVGETTERSRKRLAKRASTGHRADIERFVGLVGAIKTGRSIIPVNLCPLVCISFESVSSVARFAGLLGFLRSCDFIYRDPPDDSSASNQMLRNIALNFARYRDHSNDYDASTIILARFLAAKI